MTRRVFTPVERLGDSCPMPFISVLQRPANVVSLFATNQGAPAPMPETNRRIAPSKPAAQPTPANLDGIELDPALMCGLLGWQTATLRDGRVVLEVLLDSPGEEPARIQVILHRPVADELGQDLRDLATALHAEAS